MPGTKSWASRAVLGVGLVGVVIGLGGCGSDKEAQNTTAMIQGKPILESIGALGGSCSTSGMAGQMSCSWDGKSFALAPNSWETKANERERQCDAGQASQSTQVLTNHSWMVTSNEESSLEALRDGLKSKGTPSEVIGYCDWDENS